MRLEEAIVYVIVKRNGGMTTDQIADSINRLRLYLRRDGRHDVGPARASGKSAGRSGLFLYVGTDAARDSGFTGEI